MALLRKSPPARKAGTQPGYFSLAALPLFFVAHSFCPTLTLLRLPYFWDEGGYYSPAAWDFFRTRHSNPAVDCEQRSPALPSILLAAWWHLFGIYYMWNSHFYLHSYCGRTACRIQTLPPDHRHTSTAAITTLLTALPSRLGFRRAPVAHADIFMPPHLPCGYFRFILIGIALAEATPQASDTAYRLPVLTGTLLFTRRSLQRNRHRHSGCACPVGRRPTQQNTDILAKSGANVCDGLSPCARGLSLALWYAYHYSRTGNFIFGNPEFLRYNATANLDAYRVVLSLWHRILHLTMHMNMFVPVLCAIAAILTPVKSPASPDTPTPTISRPAVIAIAIVLLANLIEFSILGGALLTRYLLPMYPFVILICVTTWKRRLRGWL